MNSIFTGPQVAKIVGISYDKLDYWVKSGVVAPSIMVARPGKNLRYYTFSDIVVVAALNALRDRGISLQKVKKAKLEFCNRIGMSLEQGIRGGVIVADGKDVLAVLYSLDDAVQIMSLLKGGQMILPLDNIVSDIEDKLTQMFQYEASSSILFKEESRHEH